MSKDLKLTDGSLLKWFNKSHETFINKTTLIYGRTQSGKSTIVLEIMYLLKEYISTVFIVSQSNAEDFRGKVPNHCILNSITKDWLEKLVLDQKERAELYKIANDLKILKMLFDMIKTTDAESMENLIKQHYNKSIETVETHKKLNFAEKKHQKTQIKLKANEMLCKLYKTYIRKNKPALKQKKDNMTIKEKICLEYLDFRPHMLLILDDCASVFKKWVKQSTAIKEIFYMGRFAYITFIVTTQDDKEIDSELRKNAIVSIFTTPQVAMANFTRSSNSYSREEKQRSEECIRQVFKNNDSRTKNFKKLVYYQHSEDPFMYMIADLYPDFIMGSPYLWKYCNELDNKSNVKSDTNFLIKYSNV
jgi:energy-coupling factor transporter ATP-binding protein EcfA2